MIIKANSRKDGGQLAKYLLTENAQQKAFVLDHRGSVADDLPTILRYWETEALAVTKGEKPLYHMQLRLAPGETLQKEQWFKTLDVVEKKLKLTDHPRVVVAHNLNGEAHLHVVYSRLDPERGKLLNMGNDRKAHHAAERQMEKEFGLRELDSTPRRDRNGNEKTRSIEHKMAKDAGTTRTTLCRLVKAAWNASDTGRQFQDNLARFGITMTRGDRRDYNLWHEGKRYSPVRLIEEVKTAEFRAKMQIDPPRINEPGAALETTQVSSATRRRAENLTSGQAVPNFANDNITKPDMNGDSHDVTRRRAKYLTSDQAVPKFANDNESAYAQSLEDRKREFLRRKEESTRGRNGAGLEQ